MIRCQVNIGINQKNKLEHIIEEICQNFQIQEKTKSLIFEIDLINEEIIALLFLAKQYETCKSNKFSVEFKNIFHLENALKFRCEGNLPSIIKYLHQFNKFIIDNEYTRITPYFLANLNEPQTFDTNYMICDIYACISGNII